MSVAIKVPAVGESITEGVIVRWHKKSGDVIRADEALFELETDKATTTVPAPAAGKLSIDAEEGQTVAIGSVVGQIDDSVTGPTPKQDNAAPKQDNKAPIASAPPVSPAAQKMVAEAGIDPTQIPGTGKGGRIIKEDVAHFLEDKKQPALPTTHVPALEPAAPERRERLSAIRQRIAEKMVLSQKTTATLTTFNETDLSAVMALRARYKERFKEKHQVNLGFMPFFVKACVEGLRAYPIVNAFVDGQDVIYHESFHIGVAVSTPKGLMVPVLRDAGRLSFAQIEKAIADVAARARDGKIAVQDLQGGTFTITNGGVFGSLLSTPILNPPQSAILGMHTIQKRPVVVDDQIVIRPMMYLALSYDHRLIDGQGAVQFLVRVKECVENPERLLLEV